MAKAATCCRRALAKGLSINLYKAMPCKGLQLVAEKAFAKAFALCNCLRMQWMHAYCKALPACWHENALQLHAFPSASLLAYACMNASMLACKHSHASLLAFMHDCMQCHAKACKLACIKGLCNGSSMQFMHVSRQLPANAMQAYANACKLACIQGICMCLYCKCLHEHAIACKSHAIPCKCLQACLHQRHLQRDLLVIACFYMQACLHSNVLHN